VLVCKPRDPEAKGLIERCHDYLERAFLPGRTFDGPEDFNTQLEVPGQFVVASRTMRSAVGPLTVSRNRRAASTEEGVGLALKDRGCGADATRDRRWASPRQ
jgi:hypothetical protein